MKSFDFDDRCMFAIIVKSVIVSVLLTLVVFTLAMLGVEFVERYGQAIVFTSVFITPASILFLECSKYNKKKEVV